jgi:hypothetical protein
MFRYRHLYEKALRRDNRILTFNRESDLPALNDPPHAIIGVELSLGLGAGSHLHVVGWSRLSATTVCLQLDFPLCDASSSESFQCGLLGATHVFGVVGTGAQAKVSPRCCAFHDQH